MKKSILIISLIILGINSCNESNNPNQLDSDTFKTKEERVKSLKNQIKSKSNFNNAEFELFNVNGFSNSRPTSIPGASSWNYKFVIKVAPSDIDKWTEGLLKIEPTNYDFSWTKIIVEKRASDWITNSQPEFYKQNESDVMVIVYRNEGILYKRIITN